MAEVKHNGIILPPGYRREESRSKRTSYAGGNRMIPAATQTNRRKVVWLLDGDVHRNVSAYGRRTMLTLGRHLYCAYEVVRGAVEEMVEAVAPTYLMDHRSEDQAWAEMVQGMVYRHDRVCDVAGPPYSMATYREQLVRGILMDGDVGTVYVVGADGEPRLQVIPGHRIGSGCEEWVEGGEFDGARIVDGVIVGEYGQAIGYRVLTGDGLDGEHVDVPTDRMRLDFLPQFAGQLRGFSLIGFSAWKWKDLSESQQFELLAQKAGASRVWQVWNEEGEADAGADYVQLGSTEDGAGTPAGHWEETIDENVSMYWRSSDPNSRMEAVKFDRPTTNQQAYTEQMVREGLYAAGWSIDYGLLPIKISQSPLRVLVEKLNTRLWKLRSQVVEPALRRFDAFRLGRWIATGKVPVVADWYEWEYQPPRRLTADRKYDSDVARDQIALGLKSRDAACMELGEDLADVRAANVRAVEALFKDAAGLSQRTGMPLNVCLNYLERSGPNGLPVTGGEPGQVQDEDPDPMSDGPAGAEEEDDSDDGPEDGGDDEAAET